MGANIDIPTSVAASFPITINDGETWIVQLEYSDSGGVWMLTTTLGGYSL
jgi:hypothetical protein